MLNRQLLLRGISLVVALVGLWVLLQSPSLAQDAANATLRSHGGGMDTNQYIAILYAYSGAYALAGGILLGIGTLRALLYIR